MKILVKLFLVILCLNFINLKLINYNCVQFPGFPNKFYYRVRTTISRIDILTGFTNLPTGNNGILYGTYDNHHKVYQFFWGKNP